MLLPAATGRPEAPATRHKREPSDAAFHAQDVPRRHHHLFQRGVAGTFAQAIDGGAGVRSASLQRGQRVGGGQAEIVMGVDFDVDVGLGAQRGDALARRERVQQAQRVGIAHAHGAMRLRHLRRLRQEAGVGA
jgi:hypothetical protein